MMDTVIHELQNVVAVAESYTTTMTHIEAAASLSSLYHSNKKQRTNKILHDQNSGGVSDDQARQR
jgi:hypothetical protein